MGLQDLQHYLMAEAFKWIPEGALHPLKEPPFRWTMTPEEGVDAHNLGSAEDRGSEMVRTLQTGRSQDSRVEQQGQPKIKGTQPPHLATWKE